MTHPAPRAAVLLALACVACAARAADTTDTARVETFSRDGVTLTLRATPAKVTLAADVEVTLELTHPEGLEVSLPERFDDRFEGFRLEGAYEGESLTAAGTRRRTLHLRARPVPAAERYRIAPFAVRVNDPARGAEGGSWFPTKPIVFEVDSLLKPGESVPDKVTTSLEPIWVRPSAQTIARWVGLAVAAVAGLALLVWLGRKLRRRVVLARMAPRERALLELRELLDRGLPAKGRVKEFYVALTLVVRRYIERRHAVRAPEQTTEEFLREAAKHPAFTPETLARLREFLDSADLVKFAGVSATTEAISQSVASARSYLEHEPMEARNARKEAQP
jgi:hypothetical protein